MAPHANLLRRRLALRARYAVDSAAEAADGAVDGRCSGRLDLDGEGTFRLLEDVYVLVAGVVAHLVGVRRKVDVHELVGVPEAMLGRRMDENLDKETSLPSVPLPVAIVPLDVH